jgi:hypothetical protein
LVLEDLHLAVVQRLVFSNHFFDFLLDQFDCDVRQ